MLHKIKIDSIDNAQDFETSKKSDISRLKLLDDLIEWNVDIKMQKVMRSNLETDPRCLYYYCLLLSFHNKNPTWISWIEEDYERLVQVYHSKADLFQNEFYWIDDTPVLPLKKRNFFSRVLFNLFNKNEK